MDPQERRSQRNDTTWAALSEVNGRLDAVDSLEASGFDVDIITDIHPHLLDPKQAAGKYALEFWQTLAVDPAKGENDLTALLRYHIDTEPGCYGFGAEPKYSVQGARLRIFDNLKPDDVKFTRDRAGNPLVVIDHPARVYDSNGLEPTTEDATVLFYEKRKYELLENPSEHEASYAIGRGTQVESAVLPLLDGLPSSLRLARLATSAYVDERAGHTGTSGL